MVMRRSGERALVTGASSGIGRALALKLASEGYELVLTGRDEARLREVAAICGDASVIVEDLSTPGAADRVAAKCGRIDVLVNNAGFGVHGRFWETDRSQEEAMIMTHVTALYGLTKLLLPGMIARDKGRILNVGSVYSYAPVPEQAMYGATKAFLLSLSESLNGELRGTKVRVTAVLPGMTRTQFRDRAGVVTKRLRGMWAAEVAEIAYAGMAAGRRIVVPGWQNKLFIGLARHLPPAAFSWVVRQVNAFRGLEKAAH